VRSSTLSAVSVPTWLLLVIAIAGEVAGTAALRLSDGLTRPLLALAVGCCYSGSIAVMGRILKRGTSLGVAYGLLTACGLIAATGLSLAAFGDSLTVLQVAGVGVLGAGAWLLQVERT
jgi:small multidrug resistance pump